MDTGNAETSFAAAKALAALEYTPDKSDRDAYLSTHRPGTVKQQQMSEVFIQS